MKKVHVVLGTVWFSVLLIGIFSGMAGTVWYPYGTPKHEIFLKVVLICGQMFFGSVAMGVLITLVVNLWKDAS